MATSQTFGYTPTPQTHTQETERTRATRVSTRERLCGSTHKHAESSIVSLQSTQTLKKTKKKPHSHG